MEMVKNHQMGIVGSAVWAAFGDALGFMSELVEEEGLRRRIGSTRINSTVPWQRLLGGKYGARVNLPAGCYSDDTQLRLSTCRAIRGDGYFDVEAFAKIELPTWLAYSLGAGVGTKAAANNLINQKANWFSNFFQGKVNYFQVGGNGAAMRIQPHVWVSNNPGAPETYLLDVVRNTICTHGHPRALLGAVFHAICLGRTIVEHTIPSPDVWHSAIKSIQVIGPLIRNDAEISSFWLPIWEDHFGKSIESCLEEYSSEMSRDIEIIENHVINNEPSLELYRTLLRKLDALDRNNIGSGSKTSLLASALAWMFKESDPEEPLLVSANALGSDTDTIGTMAGAIVGVIANKLPKGDLADKGYIMFEADRLSDISNGKRSPSFSYPELARWSPPKSQLDVVGVYNGSYQVAGLGRAKLQMPVFLSRGSAKSVWQWMELEFGQTIVCKRREEMNQAIKEPEKSVSGESDSISEVKHRTEQADLWKTSPKKIENELNNLITDKLTLNEITKEAINSEFDPVVIGRHILEFAERPDGIEKSIAYIAIVVKARMSRNERKTKSKL